MINDKQRIFDATVCMLVGQGQRSIDSEGQCAYRGQWGLRCAAGMWIPNDKYDVKMEGNSVKTFYMKNGHPGILPIHEDCYELLVRLQRIHDRTDSMFNAGGFQQLLILAGENLLNTDILMAVWRWERLHPDSESATLTA